MAVQLCVLVLSLAVLANGQADIRLVDSFGSTFGVTSGRVEVYYNGQWGTVCDDFFDREEAEVACRQLGYSGASSWGNVVDLGFPQGTDPIWLDNVVCTGSESSLFQCNHNPLGDDDCGHHEDTAVRCISSATAGPGVENRDEAAGVRLVGSNGFSGGMAGRVDVYYREQWYALQDSSSRDTSEANVICRQLGFSSSVHYGDSTELGYFENSAIASISFLSCSGSESRWNDCFFSTSASSTSDSWAVSCAGTYNPSSPQSGDIRLNTGGTSRPFSGRLEYYYNGQWGTVCDDGFGQTDADVACRQLGLDGALYYGNVGQIGFGQGSGTIWLDDLACSSSDTILTQCTTRTIGFHNCAHSEDVALVCFGEGSLRVTSDRFGTSSATLTSGRLEVFAGGRWGTVCDDRFGQTEADLACRGIGQARATSFGNVGFSSDFDTSLSILLDDVSCTGSETNILLCSHRGIGSDNCVHSEDIVIHCSSVSLAVAVGVGLTVPIVVITIIVIVCCVCCCYCAKKTKTTTPRVTTVRPNVATGAAVTTTTYTTTTQPQGAAYPLQPTGQFQSSYAAPYPSGQYASPYPSAYPSAPQQPPAGYPIGQAPPAPYSSGPQAPPPPHPSTQVQSGEEQKSELYPDAPPAYGELMNYPGQYPNAQETGYAIPQQPAQGGGYAMPQPPQY